MRTLTLLAAMTRNASARTKTRANTKHQKLLTLQLNPVGQLSAWPASASSISGCLRLIRPRTYDTYGRCVQRARTAKGKNNNKRWVSVCSLLCARR